MAGRSTAVSDQPAVEATDIASLSFDEALAELQRTVAELEQGGLALERSIALYERGVALHERCAGLLGEAELRVQKLLERSSGALEAAEMGTVDAADQE
jgi:exodeoxyribonuclease VII small subunit